MRIHLMIALLFFMVISITLHAQNSTDNLFVNDNPILTKEESQLLDEKFKDANYSFKGKCIGFVELVSSGFCGLRYNTWNIRKKDVPGYILNNNTTKLIVMDSFQKIENLGYDALVVFVSSKNKRKLKQLNIPKLIAQIKNRDPQIPANAGLDTNSNLNEVNAIFFNEVLKDDFRKKRDFDFRGKKIAIFNSYEKYKRVSIPEYVSRIRSQVDTYGFNLLDFIYYLNEEQKKETGGYDVIIQYHSKKDLPVESLIGLLKQKD